MQMSSKPMKSNNRASFNFIFYICIVVQFFKSQKIQNLINFAFKLHFCVFLKKFFYNTFSFLVGYTEDERSGSLLRGEIPFGDAFAPKTPVTESSLR